MAKKEWTNEDVAQVLDDARDLMNESGAHWTQGQMRRTFKNADGSKEVAFCAIGAIRSVAKGPGKMELRWAALQELEAAITQTEQEWGYGESRVMGWNDNRKRTWNQVSRKFTTVSNRLRKRKTKTPYL